MKLSDDFVLRSIGDEVVLVPIGKKLANLGSIIVLNSTSAFVVDLLKDECCFDFLLESILYRYNIDHKTAKDDLALFLNKIKSIGLLSENSIEESC